MHAAHTRHSSRAIVATAALALWGGLAHATPIYLNQENMTVALGPSHGAVNPFINVSLEDSLNNIIDAPSAASGEFHTQTTHVWARAPLELIFDLQAAYDLMTFHFWNYHSSGWAVGSISLDFLDSSSQSLSTYEALPYLGGTPDANNTDATEIFAQDFDLTGEGLLGVRYINAVLMGGSIRPSEVDFQNMGFTASLSEVTVPPDPPPTGVPEPATLSILATGLALLGIGYLRRRLIIIQKI